MRDSVEKFLVDDIDADAARAGIFEKLGNSLGALGFLIDMLSYQRELAKKLFVYDEELGEFKPLMGRQKPTKINAILDVAIESPINKNMPEVALPLDILPVALAAEVVAPIVVQMPQVVSD